MSVPVLITLASFNTATGGDPYGSLIVDGSGNLFGTTRDGGSSSVGAVFALVKTETGYAPAPTTLAYFNGSNGAYPYGSLIADASGNLFGTAQQGGAGGVGTIFEIPKTGVSYASTATVLVSFNGADGALPLGSLIADANGDLFGTTQNGGTNSGGTVFEVVKTGSSYASTATTLVSFDGTNASGLAPYGSLLADAEGNLFGTTSLGGGTVNQGTVFEIVKTATGYANTPTTLVRFSGSDGAYPQGSLIADASGNLFGTTSQGGSGGFGTVFEIAKTASGYAAAPTTLVNFNGTNGATPVGSLIVDHNGNLFGTTGGGGSNGEGTLFEIVKTDAGYAADPVTLTTFRAHSLGAGPQGSLFADAQGNLYGTTVAGGAGDAGSIFELYTQPTDRVVGNLTGAEQTLTAPLANTIVQGGGYDLLDFRDNPIATASTAYTMRANGDGTFNLTTTGSSDHLSGLLQIAFSDRTLTIAEASSSGEYIALLFQAALGRSPDAQGLAGWIQTFSTGTGLNEGLGALHLDAPANYNGTLSVPDGFVSSAEFVAKYGALTDQQFVTDVYANALDRAPDPAGFNGWLSALELGASRGHVLLGIAGSQEAINDATQGFVGQSDTHAAWLFLT